MISESKNFNSIISGNESSIATISAAVVDVVTNFCFLVPQTTQFPSWKPTKPVTDFASYKFGAKDASTKSFKEFLFELNFNFRSFV